MTGVLAGQCDPDCFVALHLLTAKRTDPTLLLPCAAFCPGEEILAGIAASEGSLEALSVWVGASFLCV